MAVCPSCRRENPEGFQFCGFCSAPLASEGPEVRKVVTVLFSDVTGSTALGERLDPESLRRVMSRYFAVARSVLDRHGGTVEKFIGDAVMAVFGVPMVHEDDPLRAVRAASELRDALDDLNRDLERESGVRVQIRTGVNTGEVIAGDPSSGQSFVSGDAVNVAARLEQASGPGEILIGEDTLRLVRNAVRVEAIEPLTLKGKADPVPAFRLIDLQPGVPALARRLDSPMVGRDEELQQLLDAFDRAEAGHSCELVSVLGEAGVGKSRLMLELLSRLTDKARLLEGRCLPYGEGITFWPVAEMVKQMARIDESDSPPEALAKIGRLLEARDVDDVALIRDRVGAAIGLRGAPGAIQETFWAIRRLLESLATDRCVVAVFEDIHWAEPTLLDLIEYVAGFSRRHRLLLVCTARPELRENRPDWDRSGTVVTVSPLDPTNSGQLVQNLIGETRLPSEARDRIVEAAEGNPLFVEEMLRMLIDDGLLQRDEGRWVPTGDLSNVAAPRTIQALIAARLDRLLEEERAVIQRAAVVGQVFYWGAVTELSVDEAREGVGRHLQTLQRKELIRPEPSPFAGEDAFRFSHILVRDAAYESVPKRTRAMLHERFASWLERVAGDRLSEYEEIVGYHLEQAHRYLAELGPVDYRAQRLAERASALLASSGRGALDRGDLHAAQNLLSRALDLLAPGSAARPPLLADLSIALEGQGSYEEANATLEEAAALARAAGDLRTEAISSVRRVPLRARLGSATNEAQLADLHSLLPALDDLGDDRALGEAWRMVGLIHFYRGKLAEAGPALDRSIRHARIAGDRRGELFAVGLIVGVLVFGPTSVAEATVRLGALLDRTGRSKAMDVQTGGRLCLLKAMDGRIEEARVAWREAMDASEELGERMFGAAASMYLGWAELIAGDPARAEAPMREGAAVLERAGERGWLATLAALLAEILWRQGKTEEAERFAGLSSDAALADDSVAQVQWRAVRAKLLAVRGRVREAEVLAREAIERGDRGDYVVTRGDARMSLAYVLRAADRRDEAAVPAREALELFERKGDVADAERARSLLEDLTSTNA
jgi:class 3 adenylate cyclase/tetratricopeptide (TPR) repeat protein